MTWRLLGRERKGDVVDAKMVRNEVLDKQTKAYIQVMWIITVAAIVSIGLMRQRPMEIIIIAISFLIYKSTTKDQFHSKSNLLCAVYTVCMFGLLCGASMPIKHSLMFPVLLGFGAAYILMRYEQQTKPKEPEKFTLKTARPEQIRDACISHGLTDDHADFLIDAYRSGMTRDELAVKYFISTDGVKKRLQRWSMRLES